MLNICQNVGKFWVRAVDLTTRLRRLIGCLRTRWLDASKPLVLAGAVPTGGFLSAKKAFKNQIMRIHYKIGVLVWFIVYTQKKLLCIHKRSLVHAQHSCACQGPGTQKRRWAGPGPWTAPFLGPWPLGSLAQSMHKSVAHAQEISCVYTRDSLCIRNQCINVTSVAMLRS